MLLLKILTATTLVGLISIVCILLLSLRVNVHNITFHLVSLASGTMLGGAFLHLMPETLELHRPHALPTMAVGVFIFFILEKLLIWRHCHHHNSEHDHAKPVAARMVLAGDAIHNFIDGVIIASGFMVNPAIGTSVTVAIILHEIPHELGDYGILLHGGYSSRQALVMNALTATAALAGALIAYFFFGTPVLVEQYVLPIAAGGFLYIALADLIPQLHEHTLPKQSLQQIFMLALGFGLMALLKKGH